MALVLALQSVLYLVHLAPLTAGVPQLGQLQSLGRVDALVFDALVLFLAHAPR